MNANEEKIYQRKNLWKIGNLHISRIAPISLTLTNLCVVLFKNSGVAFTVFTLVFDESAASDNSFVSPNLNAKKLLAAEPNLVYFYCNTSWTSLYDDDNSVSVGFTMRTQHVLTSSRWFGHVRALLAELGKVFLILKAWVQVTLSSSFDTHHMDGHSILSVEHFKFTKLARVYRSQGKKL